MSRPVMLITGASRGIGAATARLAASSGYDVAVNYAHDVTAANAIVAACQAAGAGAFACRANVANEDEVIELFDRTATELGPIAAVINNAGVVAPIARFESYSVERMQQVLDVNVLGAFIVAREAVRRMSTNNGGDGGAIVNVSSAASYLGSPNEFIDYAASKGAMDTFTVGLAKEVATEGIRVNAVRPGLIDTEIHASAGAPDRIQKLSSGVPMRRGGSAEEVADAILWLAGETSTYVTGTMINVAGGR